jgi:hypothetical protein
LGWDGRVIEKPRIFPFSFNHWLPLLFLVLCLLPGFIWLCLDQRVWSFDEAWYGEVAVDLWWNLSHQPWKWPKAMLTAFGSKAPGIAWLGQWFVPLGQAIGSVEAGLQLSVLACQAASLLLIFATVKELFAPPGSLLYATVLIVASAPLFVGMSERFFVEPLQMLGVAWIYYLAGRSRSWDLPHLTPHLVWATALAMIAKVSTPIYCLLPGTLVLWRFFRMRGTAAATLPLKEFLRSRFMISGLVFMMLAVLWYARNLKYVVEHTLQSASGELALAYGHLAPLLTKMTFWLRSFAVNLLYWPSLFVLGAVTVLAIVRVLMALRRTSVLPAWSHGNTLAVFALVHLLGVVLLFSLQINEESRYLLPLLPALAILFAWLLNCIGSDLISRFAMGILLLQFIWVNGQSLGVWPRDPAISQWLTAVTVQDAGVAELKRVVRATCHGNIADRMNICGVEYPWLNANVLSFHGAEQRLWTGYRCHYTSLGYAEDDVNRALVRIREQKPCYLVSVLPEYQEQPVDCFNQVSGPVLETLLGGALFERGPAVMGKGIVILRNTGDPSCAGPP